MIGSCLCCAVLLPLGDCVVSVGWAICAFLLFGIGLCVGCLLGVLYCNYFAVRLTCSVVCACVLDF